MDKNIYSVGKNCIVEEGRGQIYRGAPQKKKGTENENNYRLGGRKSQLYQGQFGVQNRFCIIRI